MEHICKLILFDVPKGALNELMKLPVTISQYASENIVDICPLDIHKARSLQGDFIVFGNDMNDRTLFEEASYSICVGNGEVAQFASRIITEQEVAQTIRTMNKFIRKLN
ncbi:HAD hydrolase family protein [Lysinibacillus louembei]|uniref:HAD hydrolase family protein n=1 Tax=Lysinibacillus louembei TaxID=1470088 RepID=A0ABZ0RWD2_9BACI|nr:HAD hydrolase family protein [Lysinibacillus louembei]WPK11346.1 HAD hydrolase family protein [Lysinibacillus louembei]